MHILYCKKWWFMKKKPIDILDEDAARNNHLNGNDYTAVLSQNDKISHIIEFSKNDILVGFMNDNQDKYLTYAFSKKTEEDIFLYVAYYHNYEAEKETEVIIFSFEEDGRLYMEKTNLISGESEERENVTDVSCNWEKFPEFGKYSGLIKLERDN